MKKLLLVDGNSMLFRAFYATMYTNMMKTSNNIPTNAVYGFANMLFKGIELVQPDNIVVAFDSAKKNFRHELCADYKAGRKPTPSELVAQFALVREFLDSANILRYEQDGIEADDIIGTIAQNYPQYQIEILTSDKDLLQTIDDTTNVWLMKKGLTEIDKMDVAALYEKYKLKPKQIIDLKGLMGDASDNIKGIPSVGEKTALKLLYQYESVENVILNVENLKGKLKETVIQYTDQALLSKQLATIKVDAIIPFDISEAMYKLNNKNLKDFYLKYEMNSLAKRINVESDNGNDEKKEKPKVEYEVIVRVDDKILNSINLINYFSQQESLFDSVTGLIIISDEKNYFINENDFINDEIFIQYLKSAKLKLSFDNKALYKYFDSINIEVNGFDFDFLIACFICDTTLNTYDAIAYKYDLNSIDNDDKILSEIIKNNNLKSIYEEIKAKMQKLEMCELFNNIEMPLIKVLFEMEKNGVSINRDVLDKIADETLEKINVLTDEIYLLADESFNINSPKQLAVILFDKLQLKANKKRSTSIEILEKLIDAHPIVDLLMKYRKLSKLYSTYANGLKKYIETDNKIHTEFNQCVTTTGRLSSTNPNLQNISVRDEDGKQIRKAFVASKGCTLVACDYSQIELRILADMANETKLIEAFNDNIDVHTKTAMEIFHVSIDEVSSQMRSNAKTVNFGIVYGISDFGLATQLNIGRNEAHDFIEKYFLAYPNILKYTDETVEFCEQNGYVTTMFNRRREIREIHDANYMVREFGKRAACNARIQGSAADLIKIAMIRVAKKIKENNLESKLIIQVHDELIFDVVNDELDVMIKLIEEEMENAIKISVPLEAKCQSGANWFEAK